MAADYLASPTETAVERPFHLTAANNPGSSNQQKQAKLKPRTTGTVPIHSNRIRKYGRRTMPKLLRRLLKKSANVLLLKGENKSKFADICSASLARSTWLKYGSVFNNYAAFCKEKAGKLIWPPKKQSLNSFVLWCAYQKNLSASSIQSYISALATVHKFTCPGKTWPDGKTAQLLIRGVQHQNFGKTSRRKSDPLTFEILKEAKIRLKRKRWSRLSKTVLWAVCVVGYFGAFRAGELLTKNDRIFDRFSDLLWSDVNFDQAGSVTLTVKIPKTGGGNPDSIQLFHLPKRSFCPVCCLKKLRRSQMNHGVFGELAPVFRFGSGKSVTVSSFSAILARLLRHSRFANLRITAKSIRSGLPTDLEQDPDIFPDAHIKNWGRWKSRAYQGYMKNDTAQRQWIFAKISDSLSKKFKLW